MENTSVDQDHTLEAVEQQFDARRSNRTKHGRIPDYLWQAAAELCASHPITHVCKRLRLSFADLKKRLRPDTAGSMRFVELDLNRPGDTWHIECERPDGARLRFSGGGPTPTIEYLLRYFLS